jgi:pimeloyl-ACP methyl ester carboxylesterase
MHWQEAGAGEPVLLVHGFPFDASMWRDQLADPPPGWRFIAPDLRGFGRSGAAEAGAPATGMASAATPAEVAPLTMERHADDLAALLDHLGVKRAVLCGLSMGGYIALTFWRRHRERVRALILCDTRAGVDSDQVRENRRRLAEAVAREGARAAAEANLPRLLAHATRQHAPEVVERLRRMMEAQPPAGIIGALHGMAARPDSTDLLAGIDVPALVIVGDEDAFIPLEQARSLAAAIGSGARLAVIEGAGHLPPMEQPAVFNRTLASFLASLA